MLSQQKICRYPQCSPKILAQQVIDHSWPVRQKLFARGALSLGGGGGDSGVRDVSPPVLGGLVAKFSKNVIPSF